MSGISNAVLEKVRRETQGALKNTELLRDAIAPLNHLVAAHSAVLGRDLWGRLRWLLLGK